LLYITSDFFSRIKHRKMNTTQIAQYESTKSKQILRLLDLRTLIYTVFRFVYVQSDDVRLLSLSSVLTSLTLFLVCNLAQQWPRYCRLLERAARRAAPAIKATRIIAISFAAGQSRNNGAGHAVGAHYMTSLITSPTLCPRPQPTTIDFARRFGLLEFFT